MYSSQSKKEISLSFNRIRKFQIEISLTNITNTRHKFTKHDNFLLLGIKLPTWFIQFYLYIMILRGFMSITIHTQLPYIVATLLLFSLKMILSEN